jgi:glycosyltransferase involved in cell wall biosynthesis
MSMAVLESMAAGKAIVAWDTPTYSQLIEHGRTGVLVTPGDTRAAAGELTKLIDDPERRDLLGRNAAIQAEMYDWGSVSQRLLEALQSAEVQATGD